MPDNKRPGEREGLTWKEHLFLAIGCLIALLIALGAMKVFGHWIGVGE